MRLPGSAMVTAYFRSLSALGLALGTLFLAASLTPSLIPRSAAMQGVLSGISFAVGYGIGHGVRLVWLYLGLPYPRRAAWPRMLLSLACAAVAAVAFWKASDWQNGIRILIEMPPVESSRPFTLGAITIAVAAVLLLLGRLFGAAVRLFSAWADRLLPPRVAALLGFVLAAALFWSIGSGVLMRGVLTALDSSYARYDALLEPESPRPTEPGKTGSSASLVGWQGLGRAGREIVAAGPDAAQITRMSGRPAREPLRIYVGLNSAETPEDRARLALAEMQRQGAFERATLVIATPTGTGWLDPGSQKAVEYLTDGDIATVTVQYSYLPSWLALFVDAEYGTETARAVFATVYHHWESLPEGARPRLFLHGLSLGALNSDLSADLFDVIADPFQGALWAGPPFPSPTWQQAVAERVPGSPAWLPQFRDGSVIRFTTQRDVLADDPRPWGPLRIVYLQHAGDPIVFFEETSAWREPDWMRGPRGPDVSPDLRWYPVVTFLQLALDMAIATGTPPGYGHVYSGAHYLDAWRAVLGRDAWGAPELEALRALLAREQL
ncbi:alpha/beta-hydrolase family protein [Oceanicella sp. SM1341]|uniref:alpha/beta hydrolase n=1 Tax=Oceanicella sp. SM1341 TaxID=1548889 RepID=UPI0018E4F8E1|nr:alpha/beta-hydrolase family protein [Oceanicella sp. SM1341]